MIGAVSSGSGTGAEEPPIEEPVTVDMFTSGIGAATAESRGEVGSVEEPATVETFTSRIGDVEQSSVEMPAADATSVQDSAYGAHPVDRTLTRVHETDELLSSAYRTSTETGTEVRVPMIKSW
jgi:hypothetical protein